MSGHIRRRGQRSWELKFDLGRDPTTGKRETRYHSFKGTKREAQAELIRLGAEAIKGTYVDPSTETLAQFLDRWVADWADLHVSAKTSQRYRELLNNQIKPYLGTMPIQRVRAAHLTQLYAKLLREGAVNGAPLSARSVGHVHRCLRRAFGHAVQWGIITANPAAVVSPPKVQEKEIEIVREDEIRSLLNQLRDGHRDLHAIATLALATGMRRGELLALRWQDVDLEAGQVQVTRSLEQTRKGLAFKTPKSRRGRRKISLPIAAAGEMRAHRKAQQERRLQLGRGKATIEDLVFPRPDESGPREPDTLTIEWLRATAAIGRRVNLHALRHTHASSLIAAGVDILTISRRLGHAKPSVTLDVYGHLYAGSDDRAVQAMEALFARVRNG
jgi:integrase